LKNTQNSARKYKKSHKQLEKERERRRKLREYVLNHPSPWALTQVELAKMLDCSQVTVSRDLTKLGSSRWNPFRQLILKAEKEREENRKRRNDEWEKKYTSIPIIERY